MNSLENICIDKIVQKGHPSLLIEILPYILRPLIINKIIDINKPKWKKDITLVHLDLLIEMRKMKFETEIRDGELDFSYNYYHTDDHEICWKLHGHIYHQYDKTEKNLYDTTIKYLKFKGLYDYMI